MVHMVIVCLVIRGWGTFFFFLPRVIWYLQYHLWPMQSYQLKDQPAVDLLHVKSRVPMALAESDHMSLHVVDVSQAGQFPPLTSSKDLKMLTRCS